MDSAAVTITPDAAPRGMVTITPDAAPEQPGWLDREIPLDSYPAAWESGAQSLVRGLRDAVSGAAQTFGPQQPDENAFTSIPLVRMVRGFGKTAQQATEVPGAISDINQSADPLGTYARVAQDTAGQGAGQAGLALATEGAAAFAFP